MSSGIDNLAKLFAIEDLPKPEGMDDGRWEDVVYRYKGRLQAVLSALEEDNPEGSSNALSRSINLDWPNVTLEEARKNWRGATRSLRVGLDGGEIAYASGQGNAASLFLNPSRTGYEPAERIWSVHGNLSISETPIRPTRKIVIPEGRVAYDPASALEVYLDRTEGKIGEGVARLEGDGVVPLGLFYAGPDIGLSLVGFADALLKISKVSPGREEDYLPLAKRAYTTSGFRDTMYVGNKLLGIGEIPSRAYFLVPAHLVTPELRQQLENNSK